MNEIENSIDNITNELKGYCEVISSQDFHTTANIQTELMRSSVDRTILVWKSFFTRFSLERTSSAFSMLFKTLLVHLKYPYMIYKTHQEKTSNNKIKSSWVALKWTLSLPKFYWESKWVH